MHRPFDVVWQTSSARAARNVLMQSLPDLILLGLDFADGDGVELIKDFRKLQGAGIRTVVLATRDDPLSIQRAFRAGASGYVATDDDEDELLRALDAVLAGSLYATPTVARSLLFGLKEGDIELTTPELRRLSDRELQVLRRIAAGGKPSQLARDLNVSVKTIETHQAHLKEKLGCKTCDELSAKAAGLLVSGVRRKRC